MTVTPRLYFFFMMRLRQWARSTFVPLRRDHGFRNLALVIDARHR